MFDWRKANEWKQVFRYYQAGIVNTIFGYLCYALLVSAELNMYVAQVIAHILGTAFNYFTYSRYAFADANRSPMRFTLSYIFNYALSVGVLFAFAQFISSPYLAGLLAIVLVSALNFIILKRFVFRAKADRL